MSSASAKEWGEAIKSNPAEKLEELRGRLEAETSTKWLTKFMKDEEGITTLQTIMTEKYA